VGNAAQRSAHRIASFLRKHGALFPSRTIGWAMAEVGENVLKHF
jgi:hypothetical protein